MSDDLPKPAEAMQRALEDVEGRAARALEDLVARDSFGEVLALVAGNAVALTKAGADLADSLVRSLRLAGRRDIVSLGRQLARTEDKLERVLQEVEALQDELRRSQAPPAVRAAPDQARVKP